MKYVPPFGQLAGPYVNGNPAIGQRGSVIPAEAIEYTQREILNVISGAGLNPTETNLAQLLAAIQSLIQSQTGGGATADFVTMTLATSRLPIFPEILTADGRINVISPGAGTVQVPSAVQFVHRGIRLRTTSDYLEAQRTFATAASKIYHLRWRAAANVFALLDLADAAYNSGGIPETDTRFDSTFDDMLIARVVTNASNVAAITNLANLPRTRFREFTSRITSGLAIETTSYGTSCLVRRGNVFNYNFSRTPEIDSIDVVMGASDPQPAGSGLHGAANAIFNKTIDRYRAQFDVATDFVSGAGGGYVEIDFRAVA